MSTTGKWYESAKVGDEVRIDPFWNETTPTDKIECPTTIMQVRHGEHTQTGTTFCVRTTTRLAWLDSAWFNREKPLRP